LESESIASSGRPALSQRTGQIVAGRGNPLGRRSTTAAVELERPMHVAPSWRRVRQAGRSTSSDVAVAGEQSLEEVDVEVELAQPAEPFGRLVRGCGVSRPGTLRPSGVATSSCQVLSLAVAPRSASSG